MHRIKIAAGAALAAFALALPADAAKLTFSEFDARIVSLGDPIFEDGFSVEADGDGFSSIFFFQNGSGLDGASMEIDSDIPALIKTQSGNPFDLVSAEVGARSALGGNGPASLRFEGTTQSGESVSKTVQVVSGVVELINFEGFEGVVALRIFGLKGNFVFPSVDNIVLNEVSEVPLPAALPLFLAGLAGFGAASRRKKS
ncbi:MAG: VPLPA-CTERM sorting domain-containing protein [Oricola sp.]|jgi:hypothetical protein|nr:VPLPA-CTERM sorting domain-containing protein [Oricola sp.]